MCAWNEVSAMLYFRTKQVQHDQLPRRIVCQNLNGPCPLIAICNSLILRGLLTLPSRPDVTSRELQDMLIGWILDRCSRQDANLHHQVEETITLVQRGRFVEGLNVNPIFGGPQRMEFTEELSVFDLVGVPLLHGWVVDDADKEAHRVLKDLSYNQVTLEIAGNLEDSTMVEALRSLSGSLQRHLR